MSPARQQAAFAIVALFALQIVWHGVLSPPAHGAVWPTTALFALPIVPALVLSLLRHRRAAFWGSVAALLYFSHGVMDAWDGGQTRVLALVEAALSIWLILASSWDGMRARFAKKP